MAKMEDRDSSASLIFEPSGQHLKADRRRASMVAHRVEAFNGSIEEMLAEQLVAVEETLAFNFAIAERLARERLSMNSDELRKRSSLKSSSSMGKKRSVSFQDESNHESSQKLSEPLLPKSTDDNGATFEALAEFNPPPAKPKAKNRRASMSEHMFPISQHKKDEEYVEHILVPEKPESNEPDTVWTRLAQNHLFNNIMLVIILLNTVWIAIDTDMNKADLLIQADWEFQVVGNLFCTCFTVEVMVTFMTFKRVCLAFKDAWFLFDVFLVGLMVWETWIETLLFFFGLNPSGSPGAFSVLRIFRVFRLLRVARTARLLGSVPELLILAKGMFAAMRSVLVILTLLGLVIYIFAIVFTQLLADTRFDVQSGSHFQTVPASANFLMLQVLCGFDWTIADEMWQENPSCYILFLLYLLIGSLTIMNMLIGILCDVIFDVADTEREEQFLRDMEHTVESLVGSLDVRGGGSVAKKDFEEVMNRAEVVLEMTELGVDVTGLLDFANFVYEENEELSYRNFLHMVVQFRTGKAATLKDIMDMRRQVSAQFTNIAELYEASSATTQGLINRFDRMLKWPSVWSDGSDELTTWYDRGNNINGSKLHTLEVESSSPSTRRFEMSPPASHRSGDGIVSLCSPPDSPPGKVKETRQAAELFASYYIGR
mmetsp:Transcript_41440/g.72769  ORF Transcript_41440/g.72769 Transcript_41440/m.72769 type:complete len:657 (+) Transcript_41440:140-2110(+)